VWLACGSQGKRHLLRRSDSNDFSHLPLLVWASQVSTRVSHELGVGLTTQARLASAVGIVVLIVCGIFSCTFAISVKSVWGQMFNKDPSIVQFTAVALPIISICEIGNGNSLQTVGCVVLRGSAKPTIGAHTIFSAFYLFGFPVSLLCAFPFELGFPGLGGTLGRPGIICVLHVLCYLHH
jgi:Na+-driven multidrug efflux pump